MREASTKCKGCTKLQSELGAGAGAVPLPPSAPTPAPCALSLAADVPAPAPTPRLRAFPNVTFPKSGRSLGVGRTWGFGGHSKASPLYSCLRLIIREDRLLTSSVTATLILANTYTAPLHPKHKHTLSLSLCALRE